MRIPDRVLNCVGFISHDRPVPDYIGTVFVVGVASPLGGIYLNLVTAKHVTEDIDPGPFVICLKAKGRNRKIMLKSSDEWTWWHHPTESKNVDVAVMPFATSNLSEYDAEWIPEDKLFVMGKEIENSEVGIGDETFSVGLFGPLSDEPHVDPIVRTGAIAMLPKHRIPTKDFGMIEAYVVESRSTGCLSGSPVFVRETVSLPPLKSADGSPVSMSGVGRVHFLGLVHGHWDVEEYKELMHSGMSIVVPARKISEVLHHPELVQMRKDADEQRKNKNLPVTDSGTPKSFTRDDFETALKKATRKLGPEGNK